MNRQLQPRRWKQEQRFLLALSFGCVTLTAEELPTPSTPDKSQYNLFHPTPKSLTRELSADRPDKTESAYTVDAGHFQLESDFANASFDRHNQQHRNVQQNDFQFGNLNLKAGLFNNVDAQLVVESYNISITDDHAGGGEKRKSGLGDITPRLKLNLWGNDGGPTALAVLPFVKLPSNQDQLGNHAVESGIKIPLAIDAGSWDVALMTEFDFNRNAANAGTYTEFVNSISVGHKLIGDLSLCGEFFSSISTDSGAGWVGTIDTWLTYDLTKNVRLDAGAYIGATRAADDLHVFTGMTWRY